jgi:cation-transporting ATPase E
VFGRVQPEQKRLLVDALQRHGHVVAMTGDGVNDIPALKRCDIGIAVDTATPATKAVAQLVLLDGRFDRLPHVVAEGRRVIANMERVASLFVTKTVYAFIFAVVIGVAGVPFPFLPRHMSLISELTIGVPAFVLSFRAADAPVRPGSMRRVLSFAVPAGICAGVVTLLTYWVVREGPFDASLDEARSSATLALGLVGLWVLYRLVRPLDRLEALLLAGIAVAFVAVVTIPWTADLYAIDWPAPRVVALVVGIVAVSAAVFEVVARIHARAATHS